MTGLCRVGGLGKLLVLITSIAQSVLSVVYGKYVINYSGMNLTVSGPQGKTRRNNEASKTLEPDELKRAAHSFVVSRGRTGKYVSQLVMNFRKVMEPFTASQLKVSNQQLLASSQQRVCTVLLQY